MYTFRGTCIQEHKSRWLIAVWTRAETNQTAIQTPFSVRSTEALALADTNNYQLNVGRTCMCVSNISSCMLNVPLIEFMQQTGPVYHYAGDTLLAIGALTLIFVLIGLSLICTGKGWCCCQSRRE